MDTSRRVIVLGSPSAEHRAAIEAATRVAGAGLVVVGDSGKAIAESERGHVLAVLVDMASLGAEHVCRQARASDHLRRVPIIGLAKNPGELSFQRIFTWGADDLIALGAQEPLAERLLTLSDVPAGRAGGYGQAVVAEPHPERGALLGRVLEQAGYEVKYASDAATVEFYASQSETRLVILSTAVSMPRLLIETIAQSGALPVWVVMGESRNLSKIAQDLNGLDRVVVTANSGSPDDILFVANELMFARTNKRSERRALHGTPVQFREPGGFRREFGFSYDVSPSGMYVRTLAACDFSEVELELRAPRKERVVILYGRIVRRVRFGSGPIASAPAGFAVRLEGPGFDADHAAWARACSELMGPPSLYPAGSGKAPVIGVKAPRPPSPPASLRGLEIDAASSTKLPVSKASPILPVEPPAPAAALPSEPPEALDDDDVAPSRSFPEQDEAPPSTIAPPASLVAMTESGALPAFSTESKLALAVPTSAPLHVSTWATIAVKPAPSRSSAGSSPLKRSPRRPVVLGAVIGFAAVVGAVAAGFLLGLVPTGGAAAKLPAPAQTKAAAAPLAASPVLAPRPLEPPPVAAPPPPVVAAPSAGPPPASVAPAPAVPETPLPAVDVSKILMTQGYLYVRSSADTKVFVMGKELGVTNTPIVANCGMRHVRIGPRPGHFLEAGGPVAIKCRELTEVRREPE